MELNNYKNDGWGLSKLAFQELLKLLESNNISKVIEFGSGISTQFFCDYGIESKKNIEILSFDNDPYYAFKNNEKYNKLNLLILDLVEMEDIVFNDMFLNKNYDCSKTSKKITAFSTRQKNCFYNITDQIKGHYDLIVLDGPNGNGRSLAFLHLINHIKNGTYILIDDFTHYDFIKRFLSLYNAELIFKNETGMKNQWTNGGDFVIYKILSIKK